MVGLTASFLAVPVLWALTQWRLALLLCLATALIQDPLRKLTPGQPVLFVAFVGVVFGAACIGASVSGISLIPKGMIRQYPRLFKLSTLLLLLIIVQAFNSYLRFENAMLSLIGIATYTLPIFSITFGYLLVLRHGEFRIDQFMKWYIVCVLVVLPTVYLEFSGYDWQVLGQVGEKLIIYDRTTGAILHPSSGIFRASEIAAWHAATGACFVVLIILMRRATLTRSLIALTLVIFFIALGVLTGRRKIVIEFAVFLSTYFILWVVIEKRAGKLISVVFPILALVAYIIMATQIGEDVRERGNREASKYSLFIQRTESAFQDTPARFVELGIGPIMWAYDGYGLLGAGLGVATQGVQHFGGGVTGAAEGGLGKITVELGVPGLILMGWFAIALFLELWRIMRTASRHSRRMARLSFGLFSFLVANVATFSVATQAYGDFFILLILGWMLGFLLAIPVLIERQLRSRQPMIFAEPVRATA